MEGGIQDLWCHTCKRAFRGRVDDDFSFKCPCGSEFIEEITDANDPRLFEGASRIPQSSGTPRMDIESQSSGLTGSIGGNRAQANPSANLFSEVVRKNVTKIFSSLGQGGNMVTQFFNNPLNMGVNLNPGNPNRQAANMSEPQPRRAPQAQPNQQPLYPGFRNFFDSVQNLMNSFASIQVVIPQGSNQNGPVPLPPHVVNNIPRRKYIGENQTDIAGTECSICREEFRSGEDLMVLTCRHGFHESCLLPWLRQHSTCPTCRGQIVQSNSAGQSTR